MSRQKLAAAYVASQQLSALSKMDFSRSKVAEDLEDYAPIALGELAGLTGLPFTVPLATAVASPEGRGWSRFGHTLGGGAGGGLAGMALGSALGLSPNALNLLRGAGGLAGGVQGYRMSRDADPMYMKALRELGLDAYQY
jgi:hypothetical protein